MVTGRELSQGLHNSNHQMPVLRSSLAFAVGPGMPVLRSATKYHHTSHWHFMYVAKYPSFCIVSKLSFRYYKVLMISVNGKTATWVIQNISQSNNLTSF